MPPRSSKSKWFRNLTNSQKSTLFAALIGGICVVVAACVALGVPIIGWFLDNSIARQALLTPTYIPPSDSVQLPGYTSDIITITVRAGLYGIKEPFVIQSDIIDHALIKQAIESNIPRDSSVQNENIMATYVRNEPSTVWITVTGKSTEEKIQLSNQVAIKVVEYKPIPYVDLFDTEQGGGQDAWLLTANIPKTNLTSLENIIWARYDPDLKSLLLETQTDCPECIADYPTEILKFLSSDIQDVPDFFLLENNEKIVLSIATFFQEPGIYQLQFGGEYIYQGYKSIVWSEPLTIAYVLNEYYRWNCNAYWYFGTTNSCFMMESCQYSNGTYDCEETCSYTAQGIVCK